MNQFITMLIEDVVHRHKKDIPEKIIINAAHYILSCIAGVRRVKLKLETGTLVPLNYYGITFSQSGRGKDLSFNLMKPIGSEVMRLYVNRLISSLTTTKIDTKTNDTIIPSIEIKDGTAAGILQERQVLDVLKIGSTNIRVQELVAVLKSQTFEEVLNLMTESWDSGSNEARSFRSYMSPQIKDVPINALLYSSPEGFRNAQSKMFKDFIDNLANGLARRSYIVFDDTVESQEDTPTIESIKKEAKLKLEAADTVEYLKGYMTTLVAREEPEIIISISDEALLRLKLYDVQNKNLTVKNKLMKNAIKAELLSRAYKITRLAALYAFIDGSNVVSEENVNDAIEWAESLSKDIAIVLNAETIQERIYDYMEKADKYVSETDIRKFLGISAQEFKESKPEMFSVAYENGSAIQEKLFDKEGKVIRYKLIYGKKTTPENMICSASNGTAHGYKPLSIGFLDIPDLVKGKYGSHYSAGQFVDQHRCIENFIKRSNLIILDIDDGTTIKEALFYLSEYRGYICTTRNHQKEKNSKPACDRFRVILISAFEFNLDPEEHKATIKNMAEYFGLKIDTAAVEVARFYFAHKESEIIRLEGQNLVDLRAYIPETQEERKTSQIKASVEHLTRRTDTYDPTANINAFDAWCLRSAQLGSRNNILYRTMTGLLEHKDITFEQAQMKIYQLNSMLSDPLTEKELETTVFNSVVRNKL